MTVVYLTGVLNDGSAYHPSVPKDPSKTIAVYKGIGTTISLSVIYPNGSPVDLTNRRIVLTVRRSTLDDEVILQTDGSIAWGNEAKNKADILIAGILTRTWEGTKYVYDIWCLEESGDIEVVVPTSRLFLSPSVSNLVDADAGAPSEFLGPATAAGVPTSANKRMTAENTTADGDLACATAVVETPIMDSHVTVRINGLSESVGDGAKDGACYFSGDGGTTARSISDIVQGDLLYWVGSIAEYQLTTDDVVDFDYDVGAA